MGIEELADTRSTRRTRSSTKGPTSTPETPPTPKRQPATPSSSRRGKKKKVEEDDQDELEPLENDVAVEKISPKQTPPRKRQKLADAISDDEKTIKSDESKSGIKGDAAHSTSSLKPNGTVETMDVDVIEDAKAPSPAKEQSVPEGEKHFIETIPEDSLQTPAAASAAAEEPSSPEQGLKSLEKTYKNEEALGVNEASRRTDKLSEPTEPMEVDSAKTAAKSASVKSAVAINEVKESPPVIVISEPEPEVSPIAGESKEVDKISVEEQITSTSEKPDTFSETEVKEVPGVTSQESKDAPKTSADTKVTAAEPSAKLRDEPTQVFEISSEQAVETPSTDVPASQLVDKSQLTNVTEQSKIETTQGRLKSSLIIRLLYQFHLLTDEPISAPIETETAQ